ncbi:MAG TPA: hypothetical protein VM490_08715 [Armatimonadaceae bacterium]|nr:hypothetical protein [Armatimonadaceae bacterium]
MKLPAIPPTSLVAVALLLSGLCLGGCQPRAESGDAAAEKMASDVNGLAAKSGGDWNKLSAQEKEYMVKEVSHGNEESAKKLLHALSGQKHEARPGPPGGQ